MNGEHSQISTQFGAESNQSSSPVQTQSKAALFIVGDEEEVAFELISNATVIGRLADCTIQLNSNLVNRRHARIVKSGNEFVVEDLRSTCGTYVNLQRIRGPIALQNGDIIRLGQSRLRFERLF